MAKTAQITATFPEIPEVELVVKGDASTIRAAISRGVAELFKNPTLKGKRIGSLNLNIVLTNKTVEASVEPQEAAE